MAIRPNSPRQRTPDPLFILLTPPACVGGRRATSRPTSRRVPRRGRTTRRGCGLAGNPLDPDLSRDAPVPPVPVVRRGQNDQRALPASRAYLNSRDAPWSGSRSRYAGETSLLRVGSGARCGYFGGARRPQPREVVGFQGGKGWVHSRSGHPGPCIELDLVSEPDAFELDRALRELLDSIDVTP